MMVLIPSPLRSYTGNKSQVDVDGASVAELLANLDACHSGIRFRIIDEQNRIREHIRIFVNSEQVASLSHELGPGDTVQIICALSGG